MKADWRTSWSVTGPWCRTAIRRIWLSDSNTTRKTAETSLPWNQIVSTKSGDKRQKMWVVMILMVAFYRKVSGSAVSCQHWNFNISSPGTFLWNPKHEAFDLSKWKSNLLHTHVSLGPYDLGDRHNRQYIYIYMLAPKKKTTFFSFLFWRLSK